MSNKSLTFRMLVPRWSNRIYATFCALTVCTPILFIFLMGSNGGEGEPRSLSVPSLGLDLGTIPRSPSL